MCGRECAVQLPADALGTQQAEITEGFCAFQEVFIRAEGRGVFFDVRGNHFYDPGGFFLEHPAFEIFTDQLIKVRMILSKILFILHQVVVERPINHDIQGGRGINGIVDI